jgi:aldehyde:ferredoxin oxidoreductase
MSEIPFGVHGRILEIDLSSGRVDDLPLDAGLVADYIGGRGLGARLLYDRIDPACDPLGPENIIVIAAAPLIGTNAPTAGRGHMIFKSALGGSVGTSNCGGTWAPAFKATGYDALIIRGKAASPAMIDIREGGAAILPADGLWGMDVPKATEALMSGAGDRRARVLLIGPAGENLVRFASVMNDLNRAYGRGGPGAVWGSKNLKAIRVFGQKKIQIKDKDKYQAGLDQAFYMLKQAPATKRLLRELGTACLVELINLINMLPHRNFQDTAHRDEDVERVSGETLAKKLLQRAAGCYLCPIGCQRHTRVGDKKGEGPEYETMVMIGPDCDIYDLEPLTLANYVCNELGMDTISFGGTVACAMELFERGLLTTKDTGGLELRFGRSDLIEELARRIAFRDGAGDLLAEGSYRLAEACGHPEYSMTVKKQEIPAYDPRASFTQALGYMTSPTGACHLKGGYAVSLAFFGGTKEIPRFSLLQSPIGIRNMHNLGIIQDSLGVCRFTGYAFSYDPWARMMSGVMGMDFSTARLEEIANRIAAVERLFNLASGLTSADDTLPQRFSSEPIIVAGEERVVSKEAIVRMRQDYYKARGWDEEGRPTRGLMASLRIAERPRQ